MSVEKMRVKKETVRSIKTALTLFACSAVITNLALVKSGQF